MKEKNEPVCFGHERDGTKDSCSACATRLVPYLRAQLAEVHKERDDYKARMDTAHRWCDQDMKKLHIATEALESVAAQSHDSVNCGSGCPICIADRALAKLKQGMPDTHVLLMEALEDIELHVAYALEENTEADREDILKLIGDSVRKALYPKQAEGERQS